MQQFGASMFQTVVCWHKLGKVEYECTLHNTIVLAIVVLKIINVGKKFDKSYDKNNFDCFLLRRGVCMCICVHLLLSVSECTSAVVALLLYSPFTHVESCYQKLVR